MVGDKHNSNTELIALGLGNLAVGFLGGIPATGAIARTAANVKNGGKSTLSGMVHAVVLLLVLVLLMPLASYIPMPIIAAILFIVAYLHLREKQVQRMARMTEKVKHIIQICADFIIERCQNCIKYRKKGITVFCVDKRRF